MIATALALFASFVAPEALCTDRRSGMLDLYLAGPLDVTRYLGAKWVAVWSVMLTMTVGPQLFLVAAYTVESAGPPLRDAPLLLGRIVLSGIGVALFYTAVAMGVSSLTTRKAVAAVATVLVLFVPSIGVAAAVESGGCARRARPAHARRRRGVRVARVRRRPRPTRRRSADPPRVDRARARRPRRAGSWSASSCAGRATGARERTR